MKLDARWPLLFTEHVYHQTLHSCDIREILTLKLQAPVGCDLQIFVEPDRANMPSAIGAPAPTGSAAVFTEALEVSGRHVDRHLQEDRCFPDLSDLLCVPSQSTWWSMDRTSSQCFRVGLVISLECIVH